jgi:hypothetical protein
MSASTQSGGLRGCNEAHEHVPCGGAAMFGPTAKYMDRGLPEGCDADVFGDARYVGRAHRTCCKVRLGTTTSPVIGPAIGNRNLCAQIRQAWL